MAIMLILILLGVGFHSQPWLDLIESGLGTLDAVYSQPAAPDSAPSH